MAFSAWAAMVLVEMDANDVSIRVVSAHALLVVTLIGSETCDGFSGCCEMHADPHLCYRDNHYCCRHDMHQYLFSRAYHYNRRSLSCSRVAGIHGLGCP